MSVEEQIKELSAGASLLGITLTDPQTALFEGYMKKILAWSRRRNLVSRKDLDRVGAYHIVDSLSALDLLPDRHGIRCLDIGSGAGFPGIPLKIVRPDIALGLVEPRRWRYLFLENLIAELGLTDVTMFRARVEDLPATFPSCDAIFARAVASLRTLIPFTLPRLLPGGVLIAFKAGDALREIKESETEILTHGGRLLKTKTLSLPLSGTRRVLVVIEKS
jgi:16S rRNA (guanine527-N7)-methyltransferase